MHFVVLGTHSAEVCPTSNAVIVETDSAEALDSFVVGSRLAQWNQVRILPSVPMQQAMQELQETASLF